MNPNPIESIVAELVVNVAKFKTDLNAAIDAGVTKAGKGFDDIQKKSQASFGQVAKTVTMSLGGAAFGAAVSILSSKFKALDDTMAGVSARANLTKEQTDKLTASVINLSKSNLQSQDEIARTAEGLITLQGVSADNQGQIDKLTQSYLHYALVTGQTAPDAVAAFQKILNSWNLTADDGAAIMDKLTYSHEHFGTSVTDAQAALVSMAPAMQALGLSIDDSIGYINGFTKAGIDATTTSAAFNKATAILTDNTAHGTKNLESLAGKMHLTADETAAFLAMSPADKFKYLTEQIAATVDPATRAQEAIALFGTKAGPKLADMLAHGGIDQFIVSLDQAGGSTEIAADKIDNSLTAKLKLLGNQITGRAMELTQQFAPALVTIGQLSSASGPLLTGLGALGGALLSIKPPDLSGLIETLGKGLTVPVKFVQSVVQDVTGAGVGHSPLNPSDIVQTITQTVIRSAGAAKALVDDLMDKVQNITQNITKVDVTPTAKQDSIATGKKVGLSFGQSFLGGVSAWLGGTWLASIIEGASFAGFTAGAATIGTVAALAIVAAIAAALAAINYYQIFQSLKSGNFAGAFAQFAIGPLAVFGNLFWGQITKGISTAAGAAVSGMATVGQILLDASVSGVTAFFTPENIGARLGDVVALALIGAFAPVVLAIHFREPIARLFEMIGNLFIEDIPALGKMIGGAIFDALTTHLEIPVIGGVDVWQLIVGLFNLPVAEVYLFFKKGIGDVLIGFLGDLPGLASGALTSTSDAFVTFFGTTLPDAIALVVPQIPGAVLNELIALPGQALAVLDATTTALVTFFGTTLPFAITVVIPAIPGAVIDELTKLPDQVNTELGKVTDTVTTWVAGLASYVTGAFIPWDWISAAAGAFVDEIGKWLALIWGSGIITDWVNNLSAWMTGAFIPWDWIKDAVLAVPGLILGAIGGTSPETLLLDVGTKMMTGFYNAIVAGGVPLLLYFINLPGRITGELGDLATLLYNYAYDAVDRMAHGVTDAAQKVVDAFGKLAKLLNPFSSPPGFHELPGQYAQFGSSLVDGFAGAVEAGSRRIAQAAGQLGSAAIDGFLGSGVMGGAHDAGTHAGNAMVDGFGGAVEKAGPSLYDAVRATAGKFLSGFDPIDEIPKIVAWYKSLGADAATAFGSYDPIDEIPKIVARYSQLFADAMAPGGNAHRQYQDSGAQAGNAFVDGFRGATENIPTPTVGGGGQGGNSQGGNGQTGGQGGGQGASDQAPQATPNQSASFKQWLAGVLAAQASYRQLLISLGSLPGVLTDNVTGIGHRIAQGAQQVGRAAVDGFGGAIAAGTRQIAQGAQQVGNAAVDGFLGSQADAHRQYQDSGTQAGNAFVDGFGGATTHLPDPTTSMFDTPDARRQYQDSGTQAGNAFVDGFRGATENIPTPTVGSPANPGGTPLTYAPPSPTPNPTRNQKLAEAQWRGVMGGNAQFANVVAKALGIDVNTLNFSYMADVVNALNVKYKSAADFEAATGAWSGMYPPLLAALRGQGVTFDQGGWLQPGLTLAQNKTGAAELVTPGNDLMAKLQDAVTRALAAFTPFRALAAALAPTTGLSPAYGAPGGAGGRFANYGKIVNINGGRADIAQTMTDLDRLVRK